MVKTIKFILYEFFHNKRRRKKERYGWGELLQCELKITECTAVSDEQLMARGGPGSGPSILGVWEVT